MERLLKKTTYDTKLSLRSWILRKNYINNLFKNNKLPWLKGIKFLIIGLPGSARLL